MTIDVDDAETEAVEDIPDADGAEHAAPTQHHQAHKRSAVSGRAALIVGLVMVVAAGGLAGWLGFNYSQLRVAERDRLLFLQVGRQAAINLTTISYLEVDADVQRILDSATGAFHEDFQKRSKPFVDVVKQARSITEGTVAEAGLESVQRDGARVLVAVSVKTSNASGAEQPIRGWRMRIDVQKDGDAAKVSNVEFVP